MALHKKITLPLFVDSKNAMMTLNTSFAGWLGTQEIIIILVIVLLLFGGRKIPELARGLGKGIRNFKDAYKGDKPPAKEEDTKEK